MESNKLFINSYIDMEINWLKNLLSFNIIKSNGRNINEILEIIRTDLYELFASVNSVYAYETTIEEMLKLLLIKYDLIDLTGVIGLGLSSRQKEEISLTLFMKKTVLRHCEDYTEMINYAKDNPSPNSELLISYLSDLRLNRPTQDMTIPAIKPIIVDEYFHSLSIGQKDNTSLYQYILDSLYSIHNALLAIHDPDLEQEISFTINMVRGLIRSITNSLLGNTDIDTYFYKELFTSMDLFNAIMEKTSLKKKIDYKQLKK